MSANTKYDTNVALQSDLEKNLFVIPALYANEVAIAAQSETVQTTSNDDVTVIDQSNKASSNINALDGNTNIKVGSGYNVINVNDGNSTISAAGNAYNIITIGNANTNIAVGGGQNKITAGNGNNNITTTGNGISTITLGDGINNITTTGNSNSTITLGDGFNSINGGNGNHTITTGNHALNFDDGYGYNNITVGGGNNTINLRGSYSNVEIGVSGQGSNKINTTENAFYSIQIKGGSNEIYAQGAGEIGGILPQGESASSYDVQYVTLAGGLNGTYIECNLHSFTSLITNLMVNSYMNVGTNSTVIGANGGGVSFYGKNGNTGQAEMNPDLNSHDLLINANNSYIESGSDLTIQGGTGNEIHSSGDLTINDATGNTKIETKGSFTISGADGLNLDLRSYNMDSAYHIENGRDLSNIFMAGNGNETLNAAADKGYSFQNTNLAIYANTISGAQSSFIAIAGSGDDTLTAGTGNSTFTGGAGENLFAFTKADAAGGNTVITDFSASEDNQIALFDYGLTRSSLSKLLKSSQNDAQGDAVLHLENHTITLQGVSVSDLSTNQFFVYNSK